MIRRPFSHRAFLGCLLTALLSALLFSCAGRNSERLLDLDTDANGKVDLRLAFDAENHLVRLEKDKNGDGKFDWIDLYRYDPNLDRERLISGRGDMDFDGSFETTAEYDDRENLTRVVRDRNGDGKPDVIAEYLPKENRYTARKDENYDGRFEITGENLTLQ